jgi:hypothetical protein
MKPDRFQQLVLKIVIILTVLGIASMVSTAVYVGISTAPAGEGNEIR